MQGSKNMQIPGNQVTEKKNYSVHSSPRPKSWGDATKAIYSLGLSWYDLSGRLRRGVEDLDKSILVSVHMLTMVISCSRWDMTYLLICYETYIMVENDT